MTKSESSGFKQFLLVFLVLGMCLSGLMLIRISENWISYKELHSVTKCTYLYLLQVWVSSWYLWSLASSAVLLLYTFFPALVFSRVFHVSSPAFFVWTAFCLSSFSEFLSCCEAEEDACTEFLAYQSPTNFLVLMFLALSATGISSTYLLYYFVVTLDRSTYTNLTYLSP